MTDIEQRIAVLEAIEAIKKLKHRYCFLVDAGIAGDPEKMDELVDAFADDAWLDFSQLGIHKGKGGVKIFFKDFVPQALSYAAHLVKNPVIDVDQDQAFGKWYFFVPATFRANEQPLWIVGKYDETYAKIGEKWLFKSITARFDFITPFEDGWVKTAMIDL